MKKFKNLLIALLAMFVFAVPVRAAQVNMWAYVYAWYGSYNADGTITTTRLTSGVTFKVLAIDSDTAETLYVYNDAANTSLTNPVTTTNFESAAVCKDMVAFSVDPTDATNDRYVDLMVVNTDGGYTAFYEDFDKYAHTIVIDQRPGMPHTGVIWFAHTTTSAVDTGIDFEYDTLVKDVRVEVVETASACVIDVGLGVTTETSYDADGFRDNVLLTTAGFVADTGFITAATSIEYYPVTTYGAFLYTAITGTGDPSGAAAVITSWDVGGKTYMGHVVTGANAKSLTYTVNTTATGEGYIYYEFVRMR